MGYGGPAPFAFARPSPQPRHLHRRAGLVDEDQPFRSEPCLAFEPEPAPREHVRALLLRCMAGLFLCVSPRLPSRATRAHGQGFRSFRVDPHAAWKFPYIQIENAGSSFAAMVFDCDDPDGLAVLADLPLFNWVVRNEINGHMHAVWTLSVTPKSFPTV